MLSEYWLNHLVVVIAAGKRPVSIPNLEAKPASADGTAPGRVWESRTPPQQPSKGWGPWNTRSKGPTPLRIPSDRRAHHTQRFNTGASACLRSKLLVELVDVFARTRFFARVHIFSTHALLLLFSSWFSSLAMKATPVAFPQPLMPTSFISRSPLCWLGS